MKKGSTKWPTKEGYYWFYGFPYGIDRLENKPSWSCVNVRKISNGVIFIRDGNFWYASEGAVGVFFPAEMPQTPSLEEYGIKIEKSS